VPDPRVSVICIFYDAERFFREAIDSVLAQDGVPFELLLVDDGSSDGSTRMALDYVARHPEFVRYLEHEGHANKGMSAARNLGLAHARGEFVAFVDADDRWRPRKLAEQVALLDETPEVGMVCGTVNYWQSWEGGTDRLVPTGGHRDLVLRPPETLLELYPLGRGDAPCPSDVMVRRALVEYLGGFENEFRGLFEDVAFFSKVFLQSPVLFSSRQWLDYRLHADSCVATTDRAGRTEEARRQFLQWFASYLEPRDFPKKHDVLAAVGDARGELSLPPPILRLRRRWRRWLSELPRPRRA